MRPKIYLPCVRGGGPRSGGRVVPPEMLLSQFFNLQCAISKSDALKFCLLRSAMRRGRWLAKRDGWGSVGANVTSVPAEIGDVRLRRVKLFHSEVCLTASDVRRSGESIPPAKLRTKEFRPPQLFLWFFLVLEQERTPFPRISVMFAFGE